MYSRDIFINILQLPFYWFSRYKTLETSYFPKFISLFFFAVIISGNSWRQSQNQPDEAAHNTPTICYRFFRGEKVEKRSALPSRVKRLSSNGTGLLVLHSLVKYLSSKTISFIMKGMWYILLSTEVFFMLKYYDLSSIK